MANEPADNLSDALQRQQALSRWDSDGGREPFDSPSEPSNHAATANADDLTNAELVNMRIRIIALENLLIAFLVKASGSQVELAVEMAGYISPREGFTLHPLTVKAATHMRDLVDRASSFRSRVK